VAVVIYDDYDNVCDVSLLLMELLLLLIMMMLSVMILKMSLVELMLVMVNVVVVIPVRKLITVITTWVLQR